MTVLSCRRLAVLCTSVVTTTPLTLPQPSNLLTLAASTAPPRQGNRFAAGLKARP